jgi:hypothetical protein
MREVKRMLNDQLRAVRNGLAEKKRVLEQSSQEFIQLKQTETELLESIKLIENGSSPK